jgi:hypothetical protein
MNKIFRTTLLAVTIAATLFVVSCKDDDTADTTKPVITLAEPSMNDTFNLTIDPEVHVEFTATDNLALNELKIIVTDQNGKEFLNDKPNVGGLKVYSYHEHIMPTGISGVVPMNLKIEATDENNNQTELNLPFFVKQ